MTEFSHVAELLQTTISELESQSTLQSAGQSEIEDLYRQIEQSASSLIDAYSSFIGEKRVRDPLLEFSKQCASLLEYARQTLQAEHEILSGALPLDRSELSSLLGAAVKRTLKGLRLWANQFEIQAKIAEIQERTNSQN